MSLSRVHRIYDGASRFRRVIVYTRIVVKCSLFDFSWAPTMRPYVAFRNLSSALNLDRYNSLDGRLGFTSDVGYFGMNICMNMLM